MRSDAYLPLVRWGLYREHSGPWTLGRHPYRIPPSPCFSDKLVAATVACEGGHYSGVNQYDSCLVSIGLIQVCERADIYGVSALLGRCAEADGALLQSYLGEVPGGCELRRNPRGRWRFYHEGAEVVSRDQQRRLLLGGASGLRGQWTEAQKEHARRVCAVLSALWQEEVFRRAQDAYVPSILLDYLTPRCRRILFPDGGFPEDGAEGALRAAVVPFAVNNPARAERYFLRAHESEEYQEADAYGRLVVVLRTLTFDPGIAIYPARYEAMRPVLERCFGVDLPDFAEELEEWFAAPERALFPDARSIQRELIALGYDLGPKRADGVVGPKTRAAMDAFARSRGLPSPDGSPDRRFLAALAGAQEVRLEAEEREPQEAPLSPPEGGPQEPPPSLPEGGPQEPVEATPGDTAPPVAVDSPHDGRVDRSVLGAVVVIVLGLLVGLGRLLGLY